MKSAQDKSSDVNQKLSKYNLGDPLSRFFFFFGLVSVVFMFYLGWASATTLKANLVEDLSTSTANTSVAKHSSSTSNFKTDFSRTSVDLNQLYREGPVRGSIPSILKPKFTTIEESNLNDDQLGVLVKFNNHNERFYPLNILSWHEVVNDMIEDLSFAVTYSPLTGTAAVFERNINDEILTFDVTGMLYQSNLVMYDKVTESLWSQNERRSIAGYYDKTPLALIRSSIVSMGYVKNEYPNAQVLSQDTGFVRDYSFDPYREYKSSDVVYSEFGVPKFDAKYHPKKVLYSVPFANKVYSVFVDDLDENEVVRFDEETFILSIRKVGEELTAISVAKNLDTPLDFQTVELPGYYEMWFSWAVKHSLDGVLYEN